jgi:SulP family sulfate permease
MRATAIRSGGARSQNAVAWLTAGAIIGVIEVVLASSFAALIVGSAIPGHLGDGVGVFLATGTLVLAIIAWLSGGRGIVGSLQDGPAAVLAVVSASAAAAATGSGANRFLTVMGVLTVSTVLTGAVLLVVGALRLGNVVRFAPYPVVGGFLAGTGWLLVKGGIGVASRVSPTMATLDDLFAPETLARWGPALLFAVALLAVTRVVRRPSVIPASLGVALVLFAFGMVLTRSSIGDAEAGGWLLGPFPTARLWTWWPGRVVTGADWGAIVRQVGGIATAVFVCAMATLLNVSGIELMLRRDLDSGEELRAAGLANVAAGVAGGTPGFHALSLTSLAYRLDASARHSGLVAAGVVLATLLFGARLVSLMPRMLLGGVIVFLGLGFLLEWVVDARRTLPTLEYAIVLVILATIIAWGLLPGVAVGLVLAAVLFVVTYSRTDLVHDERTGAAYRSHVDRSPAERDALASLGERIRVFRLRGFMFFGTANALLDRIRACTEDGDARVRFVVLDFRGVSGADSSAVLVFHKVTQLAESHGFEVAFAAVPDRVLRQLEHGGIDGRVRGVRFEPDVDHALQWCEDTLLETARVVPVGDSDRSATGMPVELTGRLEPFMERLDVPAGSVLLHQDEPPRDVFVLESGRLRVEMRTRDGERVRLRTMRPGVVVGEIALYTETPRTADVISETACVVLRLRRSTLTRLRAEDPLLAADVHRWFATMLAQRLAETLRMVDSLVD